MGKYDPLKTFLLSAETEEVPLTFDEIEALLGTSLPPSKRHPAWWSNNPSNNTMTRAWLEAGYRTERVDPVAHRVVFRRQPQSRTEPIAGRGADIVARLRATLGGTVRVAPDVDLTAPTGEVWDAEIR